MSTLFEALGRGYRADDLRADLMAGVTVGVIALPLAMALAIASGVAPQHGLYTAIVAGAIIAISGGSRYSVAGPTAAFVIILQPISIQFGLGGLLIATFMAGVIQMAMGVARFGKLIEFIPHPVTTGFTAGIAVVIASGQIRDALGLEMAAVPAEFVEKWAAYSEAIGTFNPWAVGLTLATVLVVVGMPRAAPRVPGSLVALLAATAAVQLFDLPVETIGSRFGAVPSGLPAPRLPQVDWATLPDLVSPAVSIALLAGIESLLSAVVADGMTGRRHRSGLRRRPSDSVHTPAVAHVTDDVTTLGVEVRGESAMQVVDVHSGGMLTGDSKFVIIGVNQSSA